MGPRHAANRSAMSCGSLLSAGRPRTRYVFGVAEVDEVAMRDWVSQSMKETQAKFSRVVQVNAIRLRIRLSD